MDEEEWEAYVQATCSEQEFGGTDIFTKRKRRRIRQLLQADG
jgi:hypothetical protein